MRHAVVCHYYTDFIPSSNDDWTARADEAMSRVNGNIDIFSSAVRTFISQRNLTSLKEAIKNGKDPYDELRYESDDTIDSSHKKRQKQIKTIQNKGKDQDRAPPIGPDRIMTLDESSSSSSEEAASLENNVDAPGDTSNSKNTNLLSLSLENSRNSKDSSDLAWKSYNLLSLGHKTIPTDFLTMLTTRMLRWRGYP